MIKSIDLKKQDKKHHRNILRDIAKVIDNQNFISGVEVKKFESKFAEVCGTKYAIGVGNGTDALYMALKALNLKSGAEVILPAMTWKSTLLAVTNMGLTPVIADINANDSNYSLKDLKKKITKKTKAIIVVHLYGNPCDTSKIKKIINKKKIFIIEDAAQAHGAYDFESKKKVGSIGHIACFSLYPAKNLGAYGDAGCVTTNSAKFAKKIMQLRNIGSIKKFNCEVSGINSRLDTIQAVILLNKIKDLNQNNKKRQNIANYYNKNIINKKIVKLDYKPGCVFHQYVIKSKFKKNIINLFKKNKIEYGEHYPISINKLNLIKKNFSNKKFPNAEYLAKYGLSLPINPLISLNDLKKICKVLNSLN